MRPLVAFGTLAFFCLLGADFTTSVAQCNGCPGGRCRLFPRLFNGRFFHGRQQPANPYPDNGNGQGEQPEQPEQPTNGNGQGNGNDTGSLPIPSGLDKITALEKRVADLEKQLASAAPGGQGPAGPAGPAGPQGPPGKDASSTTFTAILKDSAGNVIRTTTFSARNPLVLHMTNIAPATTTAKK